jgi:hypothetical protein
MLLAHAITNAVQILVNYPFEGHWWIEAPCQDYDALTLLPVAIEFEGRRYGRTGWNSDRHVAYYSTRQAFAVGA